jgi:hypothetical protein
LAQEPEELITGEECVEIKPIGQQSSRGRLASAWRPVTTIKATSPF